MSTDPLPGRSDMDASEFAENFPEGFDARYHKLASDLEERARGIGLYLDQASVTPAPGFESGEAGPTKLLVMASFSIRGLPEMEQVPKK